MAVGLLRGLVDEEGIFVNGNLGVLSVVEDISDVSYGL